MTLTIKLDGIWSSFQLASSAPPLSVTDIAIAPSARMPEDPVSEIEHLACGSGSAGACSQKPVLRASHCKPASFSTTHKGGQWETNVEHPDIDHPKEQHVGILSHY